MKTFYHSVDCELRLLDPDNESIPVWVSEIGVDEIDGSIVKYFLTFLVKPEAYDCIDRNELFNLAHQARGQTFGGELDPEIDVEIEAKLDKALISDISTEISSAEEFANLLLKISQNEPDNHILNTESWFAMTVKQSVELPPEFGEGSLKVGYRTVWAD
jgi:hypothetical protein